MVAKLHVGHAHVGLAPASSSTLFAAGVAHRHEALQGGLRADAVLEGVVARQALQRHDAFLLDVEAAQALAKAQGRRVLVPRRAMPRMKVLCSRASRMIS